MHSRRGQLPHPHGLLRVLVDPAQQRSEVLIVGLSPLPGETHAVCLSAGRVGESVGERKAVSRVEVLRRAAPVRRNDWQPGRHSLQATRAEPFAPRRQHEGVELTQKLKQPRLLPETHAERDPWFVYAQVFYR
jgi:hypothetical protein